MNWARKIESKLFRLIAVSCFFAINVISFQNCAPGSALVATSASNSIPSATQTGSGVNSYPIWNGKGATITVASGADIQAAINTAKDDDTIELDSGVWVGAHLTINKRIRIKSKVKWGAILQGAAAPFEQNGDGGVGVKGVAASGAYIQDLSIKWYGEHAIALESVKNVVVAGNRIETCGGQGILIWDTMDVNIFGNTILDPYLTAHLTNAIDDTSNTNWTYNNNHVLMDYGVQVYGSLRTIVQKNYFHGQFNQTISFKEGNRDYSIVANTVEGSSGTAILLGQNVAQYGPYAISGLPMANDGGTILVKENILRPVVGYKDGTLAEYRMNTGLRVAHLDNAQVMMSDNRIEGSFAPVSLELGVNGAAGGPTGNLFLQRNFYNGKVYDDGTFVSSTAKYRTISSYGLRIQSGVQMNVVADGETFVNLATPVNNGGMVGTLQTTNFQIIPSQKILLQKVNIPTN